mmetsp:Transcript_406/g.632  ORF Transcript_406/g.632 Transcript_406/m.632 type:complete len:586 (-) Transcript_406:285-2042(-)
MGASQSQESKKEEEERKLYAEHGVLLPPSFITSSNTTTSSSAAPENILRAYTCSPLTYYYNSNDKDDTNLNATVASRILGEYMDSGIYIGAALPGTATATPTATSSSDASIRARLHPYPYHTAHSAGSISGAMLHHRTASSSSQNSMNMNITAGCGGQFTNSVVNGACFIAAGNAAVYCSMIDADADTDKSQRYERVLGVRYSADVNHVNQQQQHQRSWRVGCGTALSRHAPLFVQRRPPSSSSSSTTTAYNDDDNDMMMVKSWVALCSSDDAVRASVEAKYPAQAAATALKERSNIIGNLLHITGASGGSASVPGELSCMLSMDLRGSSSISSSDGDDDDDSGGISSVPPITLNLQNHIQYHPTTHTHSHTHEESLSSSSSGVMNTSSSSSSSGEVSASISQVVSFDRPVYNPMDESGCPRIRNTVAWAVEMKKRYNIHSNVPTNSSSDDGNAATTSNNDDDNLLSAGVSWQVNRGLAYKLAITPNNVLRGAMILRRWAHPMITCSLLCDVGPKGMVNRGIGLHVETGPSALSSSSSSSSLYPDGPVIDEAEDDRRHETKRSLNLGHGRSIEVSTSGRTVPTLV